MPIVSFPLGRRRFAPSWSMTLLTIALCVVFVRLGEWQWQRGVHRQAEWDAFARGADAPVPLGAQDLGSLPRFKRITVTGAWDAGHQFLIDNQSHGGLPGYAVLTPAAPARWPGADNKSRLGTLHRLARPPAADRPRCQWCRSR